MYLLVYLHISEISYIYMNIKSHLYVNRIYKHSSIYINSHINELSA